MDNIGLARGAVKLMPHDRTWRALYEAEAKLLQQKLNISAEHIQHVGSTAIPGILAKPIIDVAILVDSLQIAEEWAHPLAELGYWDKGPEPAMPSRRFFAKGPEYMRTVYLHVVTSREYRSLILFRDTLRASPKLAQEYSELKVKLATNLKNDRPRYTSFKNAFIQRVLKGGSPQKTEL